ncbi:PIN domain-containing protein [Corynebacterium glyciniphilum]|uniref:PIN domain-containing protein n=1 Tax=Corynebacterium glyciniphilum TaxID=1404244 RepID=UPI003FD37894
MFTVVLDACVILPATLNDTILRLAESGSFGVRWSATIMDEVKRNMVGGKFDLPDEAAERRISAMQEAFPFAEVKDYEMLIPAMTNDPKDRHVLAAAVRSEAHTVVTMNLKDFPTESVEPWDIEVVHPDQFLLNQLDLEPRTVMSILRRQVENNRYPPRSAEDLCAALRRCGVPDFAEEVGRRL